MTAPLPPGPHSHPQDGLLSFNMRELANMPDTNPKWILLVGAPRAWGGARLRARPADERGGRRARTCRPPIPAGPNAHTTTHTPPRAANKQTKNNQHTCHPRTATSTPTGWSP